MKTPIYPKITVSLLGEDGNAFSIIGRVRLAMKRAGLPPSEIEKFQTEATSGNYDNLIVTVLRWVNTDYALGQEDNEECDNCGSSVDDPFMKLCDECYEAMPLDTPEPVGSWNKE
jgi:hypothetical protein